MAIARAALTWYATPRSRLKRPRSICAGTTVHAAGDTSHVAVRAGGTPQTRLHHHHHPHAQPNRYGEQRVMLLGAHWPVNNAVLDTTKKTSAQTASTNRHSEPARVTVTLSYRGVQSACRRQVVSCTTRFTLAGRRQRLQVHVAVSVTACWTIVAATGTRLVSESTQRTRHTRAFTRCLNLSADITS